MIKIVLPVQTELAPAIAAVGAERVFIILVDEAVHPLALVTVTV